MVSVLITAFAVASLVLLLGPALYLTQLGIEGDQHTPRGLR